jgi:CheY-like chemotaxis protein
MKRKKTPLPISTNIAEIAPEPVQLIPTRKQLAILVVDEVNEETPITHALTYSGHCVKQASKAFEALSALQNQHFDLIFIDLGGKPLETFGTTELIVAFRNAQAQQIPIIALGPELPPGFEEKCQRHGVTRLVQGRFDAEALQNVLSNIQHQRRQDEAANIPDEVHDTFYLDLSLEEHDTIYLPEQQDRERQEETSYTWKQKGQNKSGKAIHSWGKSSSRLSRASIKSVHHRTDVEHVALEACGKSAWKVNKPVVLP